jgi:hypothetical protein
MIRDRMPELAGHLEDVERVTVLSRRELPHGVRLVNEWRAKPSLPISLKPLTGKDVLIWLDHAEWDEKKMQCRWRIEPEFLSGRMHCNGMTCYEPAIGGKGCRITFEGQLDLEGGALRGLGKLLEGSISPLVEAIITTVIPRNFRRTVEAACRVLDKKT